METTFIRRAIDAIKKWRDIQNVSEPKGEALAIDFISSASIAVICAPYRVARVLFLWCASWSRTQIDLLA